MLFGGEASDEVEEHQVVLPRLLECLHGRLLTDS